MRDCSELVISQSECLPAQLIFLKQSRAEEEWVVSIDTASYAGRQERAEWMLFQAADYREQDVTRRADIEADGHLCEAVNQPRVLDRADTMLDTLRPKRIDGFTDTRWAGQFAGVRRRQESRSSGDVERLREVCSWGGGFITVKPEAHQISVAEASCELGETNSLGKPAVAVGRYHEPKANTKSAGGLMTSVEDELNDSLRRTDESDKGARPD